MPLRFGGDIQGVAVGAPDAIAWASVTANMASPGENPAQERLRLKKACFNNKAQAVAALGWKIKRKRLEKKEREDMQVEKMNNDLNGLQGVPDPVFNSSTGCLAWALEDVVDLLN